MTVSEQPGEVPGGEQETSARTDESEEQSGEPPDTGVWGACTSSQRPIALILAVGCGLAALAFAAGVATAGLSDPAMLLDPMHSTWDLPRPDLAGDLAAHAPGAFFQLGIVLVMATPVVALAATLAHYARRRNWQFAGAAGVVLTTICLSLFVNLGF